MIIKISNWGELFQKLIPELKSDLINKKTFWLSFRRILVELFYLQYNFKTRTAVPKFQSQTANNGLWFYVFSPENQIHVVCAQSPPTQSTEAHMLRVRVPTFRLNIYIFKYRKKDNVYNNSFSHETPWAVENTDNVSVNL